MLERLAEMRTKTVVFLISAYETDDIKKRIAACANAGLKVVHMNKPFQTEQFHQTLAKFFAPPETLQTLTISAEQLEMWYDMGCQYYNGDGEPKNYAEAVKWYRKAAKRDHVAAQHNLGVCYASGHGVSTDYNEAVKWYREAAKQKFTPQHKNNLGACFAAGQGVRRDHAEALKWYLKAAEQGDAKAQFNAGAIYANSQNVLPWIMQEAVKWYRKAARAKPHLCPGEPRCLLRKWQSRHQYGRSG